MVLPLLSGFLLAAFPAPAQHRQIDFRYSPEYSFTPIGFVDDWQKTMVNDQGALLYDFGPGPYVRPNTVISIGVKNQELRQTIQRLESARVPVVHTRLAADDIRVELKSFAVVPRPEHTAAEPSGLPDVKRWYGLNGAFAWANPAGQVDPAFRNVAWGTNRPIVYDVGIAARSRKKVALGFCESYRTAPGMRMMDVRVEGAAPRTIDVLADASQNQPRVFFFDAADLDGNGLLRVEIRPSAACRDPNVILNALWVFAPDAAVTAEQVIAGDATKQAEVYLDCGSEPQLRRLPTRIDAIEASIEGKRAVPVIRVRTRRLCSFDKKTGVLMYNGNPFVASRPGAVSATQTSEGWEMVLPAGSKKVDLIAINGYRLPKSVAVVPDLQKERARTIQWWSKERRYPQDRVTVPDRHLQYLLDSGMRTLYQLRDIVDGVRQFQPGSTVYRGLWVHDAVYDIDVVAAEGDTASVREAIEGMFPFQDSTGKVKVIWPVDVQRETPLLVWMMGRYARLANDREWLRRNWHHVADGMDYVLKSRASTMTDAASPFYGLMPPGFTDGGIAGEAADYSSVYWALAGADAAIDGAQWLGKSSDVKRWTTFRSELDSSFHAVAARDVRVDSYGNKYLTVRVADTVKDVPQRGQWAFCEAVNLGNILDANDPIVRGTLAILDSSCVQGLPISFGWLTGGIGVWFAPMVGLAHFEAGNVNRAHDILYAFANHSTPLGGWAEEQMPKGQGPRTTGDFPTNSAYVSMLKLVLTLLVDDHAAPVQLLRGIPPEWLGPGCVTEANDLVTRFGRVTLKVVIGKDGTSGSIQIKSKSYADLDDAMAQYTDATAMQRVVLDAFRNAGFRRADGSELPREIRTMWGHDLVIELKR